MSDYEKQYLKLVNEVLMKGDKRPTRNEATYSLFGRTLVISELRRGLFPILTSRKMHYKGVLGELAAMIRKPKHINDFKRWGCNYWDQWADEDGNLEVDYGNVWFDFDGVNQYDELIKGLTSDPFGRRHIITGWHPDRLKSTSLPCCHLLYQFYVTSDGHLDMMWYQRSADTMIGIPSDVIFAAAWLINLADTTRYKPGTITMVFGDTHIYVPHAGHAQKLLDSAITFGLWEMPEFDYTPQGSLFEPQFLALRNYTHGEALSFEVFS